MKKILVTAVLGFAVVAAGQVAQAGTAPQGQPAQGQPAQAQPALHRRKRRSLKIRRVQRLRGRCSKTIRLRRSAPGSISYSVSQQRHEDPALEILMGTYHRLAIRPRPWTPPPSWCRPTRITCARWRCSLSQAHDAQAGQNLSRTWRTQRVWPDGRRRAPNLTSPKYFRR